MGLGIAQLYAAAGFSVIATDANAPARDSARTRMQTALNTRVTAGQLTETARDATLENLTITDDLATLKPCTMTVSYTHLDVYKRPDPPIRRHAGHFRVNQPRAALGPLGVMGKIPIARHTIHRLVLRHR